MNQNDQMREALRMIDTIIDAAFDGGNYDGSEIQDMAVEHGLLKQEEMKEPCSGNCTCLEAGAEFPTQCYRKTYRQALTAKPAQLVRLKEKQIIKAWNEAHKKSGNHRSYQFDLDFATAIMDAMERVNNKTHPFG